MGGIDHQTWGGLLLFYVILCWFAGDFPFKKTQSDQFLSIQLGISVAGHRTVDPSKHLRCRPETWCPSETCAGTTE